jgi:hypothetical protein
MASCDVIVENLLALVSSIHLFSDPLFSSQVRETQISCSVCSNSIQTCSNGIACPDDPNLYGGLFAVSIFFFMFPLVLGIVCAYECKNEEEYVKEQTQFAGKFTKSTRKLITVVRNGIDLRTFYLYTVLTCKSRESLLNHYEMVYSKLHVLRQYVALWPIYGLCRVVHFIYLASNPTIAAKILYPSERTSDQNAATPLLRIVASPDQSQPKVTHTPAIILATQQAYTRHNHGYMFGFVIKSMPLCVIQFYYLISVGELGPSIFSLLVTAFHCLLIAVYALYIQLKHDALQVKLACALLEAYYVEQGHPESELSCRLQT